MGLLNYISNMRFIRKELKKVERYLSMTKDELIYLPDEEFMDAVLTLLVKKEGEMGVEECLQEFHDAKRPVYVVTYFDEEVQNGGLCQYFANSSRKTAPYILECLDIIGAIRYKNLLEDFIVGNNISLDDLESFNVEDIKAYQAQTKRYPFDTFDDAYYELCEKDPLDKYLLDYLRLHLEDFL